MEIPRRDFLKTLGAFAASLSLSPAAALEAVGSSAPSMPLAPLSVEQAIAAIKFLSELRANLFNPGLSLSQITALQKQNSASVGEIVAVADQRYTDCLVWLTRYCGKREAGLLAQTLNDCFSGHFAGSFFDKFGILGFGQRIKALSGFEGRGAVDLLEHFAGSRDDFIRAQVLQIYRPQTTIGRKELLQETNRLIVEKIMLPQSCTWRRYK